MLDRISSWGWGGGELLWSHGVIAQLGLPALARGFMASSVPPGCAPSPREWVSGEGQWVHCKKF